MRTFCEFNIKTGRLVQRGRCENQRVPRIRKEGSAIAFISASSIADTITFVGINSDGIAVEPVLHRASEAEKADRNKNILKPRRVFPSPSPIPEEERIRKVTNKEWDDMQDRLRKLET